MEEAGISTVCVTFIRDLIELVKPPRVLFLKFSAGKPLGRPGDKKMQQDIINAGFDLLQRDIDDMTIVDLPFKLSQLGML